MSYDIVVANADKARRRGILPLSRPHPIQQFAYGFPGSVGSLLARKTFALPFVIRIGEEQNQKSQKAAVQNPRSPS